MAENAVQIPAGQYGLVGAQTVTEFEMNLIALRFETHEIDAVFDYIKRSVLNTIGNVPNTVDPIVRDAIRNIRNVWPDAEPVQQAAAAAGLPPQAPAPVQQQAASGPMCAGNHGPAIWKTGNSARGPWKGWFCPLTPSEQEARGVKCKPQFGN